MPPRRPATVEATADAIEPQRTGQPRAGQPRAPRALRRDETQPPRHAEPPPFRAEPPRSKTEPHAKTELHAETEPPRSETKPRTPRRKAAIPRPEPRLSWPSLRPSARPGTPSPRDSEPARSESDRPSQPRRHGSVIEEFISSYVARRTAEPGGRRGHPGQAETRDEELDSEVLTLRQLLRDRLPEPGQVLGSFELLSRVGHGGVGAVWRARREPGGREVALKVMHAHLAQDPAMLERFRRGARRMKELTHPGLVAVTTAAEEDRGWHYYAMEYLPGGTLRQAHRGMSPREALECILDTCDGLEVAHARGWVHGKLEPSAILLTAEGHGRLTDLDLVGATTTTEGSGAGPAAVLCYIAPEALERPQGVEPSADVFSLAMVCVFALRGTDPKPWTLQRELRELPCNPAVRRVIMRAASLEPSERYPQAGPFARALRSALRTPGERHHATVDPSAHHGPERPPPASAPGDASLETTPPGARESFVERARAHHALQRHGVALESYQQMVQADPEDARAWLQLGDLLFRHGALTEATSVYLRVARRYRSQGAGSKSAALLAHVRESLLSRADLLGPSYARVLQPLAEAYAEAGLTRDALALYEVMAAEAERRGDERAALVSARTMVALAPGEPVARLRLAECHVRAGAIEAAMPVFAHAAGLLASCGREDEALKVLERILYLRSDAHHAKAAARLYMRRGTPQSARQALGKLLLAFEADPTDLEVLDLLVSVFVEMRAESKALQVLEEIKRLARDSGDHAAEIAAARRIRTLSSRPPAP